MLENGSQVDSSGSSAGGELSDSQMDSLIEGNRESRDIPMRSSPEAQAPEPQTYKLKVDGKTIDAPLEKVLQWAQLGYNYPQKAQEFNQMKARFDEYSQKEQQLKEIEQKWAPYKEVDEYAAKNPDWWNAVQENYRQKMAGAESNADVSRIKQELMQELQPIKEFIEKKQTEEKTRQIEQEDKQLSTEVDSIRKSFPNLDFDTPDEEGKSLEMKILEHAMNNDIKSFRVAFRDYYHDHLLSMEREKGKELVSKEVQKRTKLGILGQSPKPTKGLKVAENVKDKSYEQLMREALEEL